MNDQLVAETATKKYTPPAGFEPEVPAIELLQNYPLNRATTGMGIARNAYMNIYCVSSQ